MSTSRVCGGYRLATLTWVKRPVQAQKPPCFRRRNLRKNLAGLFLVAGGFFFFRQLVVPNILAQAKLRWCRLGFANGNFAAIVQKFLNKRVICGFFWDMFHGNMLTACMGGLSRPYGLLFRFKLEHRARTEGLVQSARITPQACLRHDGGSSGAAQTLFAHLDHFRQRSETAILALGRFMVILTQKR